MSGHAKGPVDVAALTESIVALLPLYPQRRSATIPALRLAQEAHGGWLPPEAFRIVADALELTPAYCKSVASFYDMFLLEPVGDHLIEVCTNVSCALVGAQQTLEAFESELGIKAGQTTPDGEFSLRTIECLGGCGWGTVVSCDHRYKHHVKPADVPGVIEELRHAGH